ncbi:hypothetical protein TSAR_008071 [Trichomalopsis sarcophagae]|uniref:Uncharacterized protein n=1 Tax=Trichomalopsis sarcophagae TaxID=543379 RepID=A0A232FNZ6_9HYME|nr:hypothetical protein TSAR_008071 [Trichomalopsis sarcophagae]
MALISILKQPQNQSRSRSVSPARGLPQMSAVHGQYGHPYPPTMGPHPYMAPPLFYYYLPGNPPFSFPYNNPYLQYPMQGQMQGFGYQQPEPPMKGDGVQGR